MNIQTLTVIFIIIIFPIVLVMSAYTQGQIDTIVLQAKYDSKLYAATYDAIKAFQSNTAHNDVSTVSDSLRRDVQASISTFIKTLSMNLGVPGYSQNEMMQYIPAILFTNYDGYYIYAPNSTTAEDGTTTYKHILKPYIYYTKEYIKNDNNRIVINYTLDNYVTVYGYLGGSYIAKSGYLEADNNSGTIEELKEFLAIKTTTGEKYSIDSKEYNYVYDNENNKIYYDEINNKWFRYRNYEKVDVSSTTNSSLGNNTNSNLAGRYYTQASVFTNWYNENVVKTGFSGLTKIDKNNNPREKTSAFNEEKRNVIVNSIQDNLNTAISSYNANSQGLGSVYNFKMPVLTETDWDNVLKNVTMVTFMQGIKIGQKMYNNYAIVNSTINKQYISEDLILFIDKNDDESYYHRIDCPELNGKEIIGYKNVDYRVVTNIDKYTDEKTITWNKENQACYYCIISGNYNKVDLTKANDESDKRNKALNTALAREKCAFYKINYNVLDHS